MNHDEKENADHRHQTTMKLPRGIINSTGTACHLSSALLLLFHALVPIRESLIELSQSENNDDDDDDEDLAMALGKFFAEYAAAGKSNDSEEAIDPTRIYKTIKKSTGIVADNLGDAVTVTMKILSSLRENSNNNNHSFSLLVRRLLTCALDSGRIRSKFVGEIILHSSSKSSASSSSSRRQEHTTNLIMTQRVKLSKERILPNPFTLNIALNNSNNCHTSLLEMLSISVAPTRINGNYQWKEPFEETSVKIDESSSELTSRHDDQANNNDIGSTITKSLQIEALPPLWILHLDRFMHHQNRKTIKAHPSLIDIPEQFDIHETFDNLHGIYNLTGAILHMSHDDDENEEEDEAENGGHLVTLVRIQEDCSSIYSYCLIDDADRTPIERTVAMELLRGSSFMFSGGDRGRCDMRGVLVVYERLFSDTTNGEAIHHDGDDDDDDLSRLLRQLQSQVHEQVLQTTMSRQETAQAMVGRRLRVQWSKGKFYAGVVAAYDPTTKKHTVQYDDGDVREYKLSKKTIEWL